MGRVTHSLTWPTRDGGSSAYHFDDDTTGSILVAFGGSCNGLGDNFNLNEGIMILLDAISIFHFPKNHLEFIQGPFDPTLKVYIDGQLWIGF